MKFIIAALALATSSLASLALANSCLDVMKDIDAKLLRSPTLSAADRAKVKSLRADGEAFNKAGKHVESEEALGQAKKLLGI